MKSFAPSYTASARLGQHSRAWSLESELHRYLYKAIRHSKVTPRSDGGSNSCLVYRVVHSLHRGMCFAHLISFEPHVDLLTHILQTRNEAPRRDWSLLSWGE